MTELSRAEAERLEQEIKEERQADYIAALGKWLVLPETQKRFIELQEQAYDKWLRESYAKLGRWTFFVIIVGLVVAGLIGYVSKQVK